MDTREWTFRDRKDWGSGPWDHEVDKRQWQDPATGLPCLIVRNWMGALCGYVGVSREHPYFEKSYHDVDVEVHGGLTFAGACDGDEHGICHVVEPDAAVWWLGFDCGHWRDITPSRKFELFPEGLDGTYRDMPYVTAQCTALAAQLASAGIPV
jgi:hypothetical protein